LVGEFERIAKKLGFTAAQLALGWVLEQGDFIFPIPGTKHVNKLEDLIGAVNVKIPKEDQLQIRKLMEKISGERYAADRMKLIQQYKKTK